jgi:hypothetical protein
MMGMRFLAGFLIAGALLAMAACNGDDDAPTGSPLPSGRTPAPTAADDAGSLAELSSAFLAGIDGRYEYLYTGPIGTTTEGILTVYHLGANDRQDWNATSFGFEATTITILRADGSNYTCTTAENYNYCTASAVPEVEALRIFSSPVYDALAALVVDSDQFEFEELPSETFADLPSTCYRATSDTRIGEGAPLSEDIKACFTDAGVLSYFEREMTPDSAALDPTTFTLELQATGEAFLPDFEPTGRVQ